EVFEHPEQVPVWHAAALDQPVDWDALFAGYAAAVDWPAGAFWPEISAAFPDAVVLLSTRKSADAWWESASQTIIPTISTIPPDGDPLPEWRAMVTDLINRRFTPDFQDADAAKAAYERHNEAVRAGVPADRLLEWQPGDGWEPICERLGLPVPAEPFPHVNTK